MTLEELEKKRLEKFQEIAKIEEQICNLNFDKIKLMFVGKYLRINNLNKDYYDDDDDDGTYLYCYNITRDKNVYCLYGISFTMDDESLNGFATIRYTRRTYSGLCDDKYIEKSIKIISKEEFDKKFLSTINDFKESFERVLNNTKLVYIK